MSDDTKEDLFLEAIKNIRDDRAVTSKLLIEVMNYIKGNEERHQTSGHTAAKYVETLQRSNEQLVKVANLMAKKEGSDRLTAADMDGIYEMISKEEEKK